MGERGRISRAVGCGVPGQAGIPGLVGLFHLNFAAKVFDPDKASFARPKKKNENKQNVPHAEPQLRAGCTSRPISRPK
jgi:hypothetical protein